MGLVDIHGDVARENVRVLTICSLPAINFLLITLHAKYSPVCNVSHDPQRCDQYLVHEARKAEED
jgi:hypothetical protein